MPSYSYMKEWTKKKADAAGLTVNAWMRTKYPLYHASRRLTQNARRRATSLGVSFSVKPEDIRALYELQEGVCALTGENMVLSGDSHDLHSPSVDRIVPSLGYAPGNIRLVCWWANIARSTLTDAEFIDWCKKVIDHAN